ncbi:uncharacterized protein BKCO1_2500066 [Diplodia corticola]|uniref:Integral membrane protein n=1 Tax=Diplodia corticola TaxID=236234 RepID=A0A1J9S3B1_9PEZI|nr:uncharacterized protein BKCO1_2500066 [Diplodia corticola]OJD34117.1 integral membrane protein [Diplodia corticola]
MPSITTYELNASQHLLRAAIIASFSVTGTFVAIRCCVRLRLQARFSFDDYLLAIALAIYALQTSFIVCAIDYGGFNRKTAELPHHVYLVGLKWTILTQCAYPLALMFAKLSIAFLQLRVLGLSNAPTVRRLHYVSIAACIIVSIYGFFTAFFQCYPDTAPSTSSSSSPHPILIPTASCSPRIVILVSSYIFSAINILLDWYYSLAMVPSIWNLYNTSVLVRVSTILFLSLGFL